MELALKEAWKYQFETYPNPAVGATVVKDGIVLSVEAHKKAGMPHAEVEALKSAYIAIYPNSILKDIKDSKLIHNFLSQHHNDCFKQCEIYVTLEPCNHTGKTPPCALLLQNIGIKKVYIGTLDPNANATGGLQRLQSNNIDVQYGVDKQKADELLKPFLLWQKDKFCFFKLAMRKDGSIDGGYITTKESLAKVHNIRTTLELLMISGKTVRDDRPRLDTRYANNGDIQNVPNILIYSNQKKFDKTIPLFNIPNRDVYISNNLDMLNNSRFSMIEGGKTLLKNMVDTVDCIMLFISHKEQNDIIFDINTFNMKVVYSYFINKYDEVVFLYRNN